MSRSLPPMGANLGLRLLVAIVWTFVLGTSTARGQVLSEDSFQEAFNETFGGEPTFTSTELLAEAQTRGFNWVGSLPLQAKIMQQWIAALRQRCDDCEIESVTDSDGDPEWRVRHPSGVSFEVTSDIGVMEIRVHPLTLPQAEHLKPVLKRLIFDVAEAIGLKPNWRFGGGHVHVGAHGFFHDDAELFREFMVDMFNHSDLLKAMGAPKSNAPASSDLSEDQRAALTDVIRELDGRLVKGEKGWPTILWAATEIERRVYYMNPKEMCPPAKFQAICLRRIVRQDLAPKERTLELRFLRPQQNVEEWIAILRLLHGRKWLLISRLAAGLRYDLQIPSKNLTTPKSKATRFKAFVSESKVALEDASSLLRDDEVKALVSANEAHRCEDLWNNSLQFKRTGLP